MMAQAKALAQQLVNDWSEATNHALTQDHGFVSRVLKAKATALSCSQELSIRLEQRQRAACVELLVSFLPGKRSNVALLQYSITDSNSKVLHWSRQRVELPERMAAADCLAVLKEAIFSDDTPVNVRQIASLAHTAFSA